MTYKILTKIKWNFPDNNGGSVDGLNDSGVETFKGNVYESLAREIIQNSIDAKLNDDEPVRVVFKTEQISSSKFPARDNYVEILESCKDYWSTNKKTGKHFQQALSILNQETISVLKISDYNTTGLTGSDQDDNNSNWFGLIKSTGNSNKEGGSGGSFGIGKNAPFASSILRTVFYSTFDKNSTKAFQGVGKLVTHLANGSKTRGTGYFGNPKDNQPISGEDLYNSDFYEEGLYKREEVGTDIFVFGFKLEEEWQRKMIVSILENFTIALYRGMLEVEVDGILISQDNLHERVKEFTKDMKKPLALLYYRALSEGERFPKEGLEYGSMYDGLELYLLEGRDLPKQVAMFRKMGMRIFDKKHFRGATNFIGVLLVSGKETNEHLREMEPAAHDKWEASRAKDSLKNPEKYLKGINDWIKKCISSLVDYSQNEELDFSGAGDYLPMEQDEPIGGINKKEVFPKQSKDEKLEIVKKRKSPKRTTKENQTEGDDPDNTTSDGGTEGVPGSPNDSDGESSSVGGDGSGDSGGKTGKGQESNIMITDRILDVKVKRSYGIEDDNEYRIMFSSNVNKVGFLIADVVGETSKEKYRIKKAYNSSGEVIRVENGEFVGPIKFEKKKDDYVRIQFEKSLRVALDIYVREGIENKQ
ncbi:hypothetical protein AB1L12_08685 [Peribacillus frigoritolerans]|uniref:hypothetical protein n=1 Tax=Peribacillus frigoritolerans TaxID=450367 RepID=UPI00399F19E4